MHPQKEQSVMSPTTVLPSVPSDGRKDVHDRERRICCMCGNLGLGDLFRELSGLGNGFCCVCRVLLGRLCGGAQNGLAQNRMTDMFLHSIL